MKIMSISHYKAMIEGKKGPTIKTLDKFLQYCGRDWNDWAREYETVRIRDMKLENTLKLESAKRLKNPEKHAHPVHHIKNSVRLPKGA